MSVNHINIQSLNVFQLNAHNMLYTYITIYLLYVSVFVAQSSYVTLRYLLKNYTLYAMFLSNVQYALFF